VEAGRVRWGERGGRGWVPFFWEHHGLTGLVGRRGKPRVGGFDNRGSSGLAVAQHYRAKWFAFL